MFSCRTRCLPLSARRFIDGIYVKGSMLVKRWTAVFSPPLTSNQEMTESTFLNSEIICAEYRDELDDYVTVTDY